MLNVKLLTCREVATFASDYLDKHDDGKLSLKIRIHLMMCANCRRFVKHLRLTKETVPQFVYNNTEEIAAEEILNRIKGR